MNTNLEERYESLKRSVNSALKMFCNKIEEMKLEVKDLKTKVNSEKVYCIECKCKNESRNIKKTVKSIEDNLTKLVEKDDLKSIDSDIQNYLSSAHVLCLCPGLNNIINKTYIL